MVMEGERAGLCSAIPDDSVRARGGQQWCDDKRIHAPTHHPQSSCYKYDDGVAQTVVDPDMPVAAQWWREGLGNFAHSQADPLETVCDTRCTEINSGIPQTSSDTSNKPSRPSVKRKTIKEHRESIKRTKQPETWKVNIKKNARLRGEEYVGVGGKIVPAKIMGPPCDCRMRCSDKIDEKSRNELHKVFWKTCNWEQRRQYIALLVKESATQRNRCRTEGKSLHRRQVTFTYSLLIDGDFTTVCKPMFLSTFSVSEKLVRLAMDKKRTSPGGIIGADQRGRHTPKTKKTEYVKDLVREHIESFPTHVFPSNSTNRGGRKYLDGNLSIAAMHKLYVKKCRENGVSDCDIVKESYYRDMFKNEFDLGFRTSEDRTKFSQVDGRGNSR